MHILRSPNVARKKPHGGWIVAMGNELSHERDVIASYIPHRIRYSPWTTLQDDLVSRVLKSGRAWEGWLTRYIREYASKDKVSIDVGANIGAHTKTLAQYSHEVIALEPQADAYRCLKENTRHSPGVQLLHAAASSESGVVSISHSQKNRGASKIIQGTGDETVQAIRLDDLGLSCPVGLMKIDVEGHERDVILGAIRIISDDRPVIILEDTTGSRRLLRSFNYRLERISLRDFLCIPRG